MAKHFEIELRFIKIDKSLLIKKLRSLKAKDLGEDLLSESIFDNKDKTFNSSGRLVRIRTTKKGSAIAFKDHRKISSKVLEIEFGIEDPEKAAEFLKKLGYIVIRRQEKKRHTFKIDGCIVDIDTWPNLEPYVEIEGPSKEVIKKLSGRLGLDWRDVIYEDAKRVLEKYYKVPVSKLKHFTFKD